MPKIHPHTLISNAILALNTPNFSSKIIRLIQSCLDFDCAVIVGCKDAKRPIYLFDSIEKERDLLFQRYLTNDYQSDPFIQYLNTHKQQGIFMLKDVVNKNLNYQNYCKQFYMQTGWKNELGILIEIEPQLWIIICLGFFNDSARISEKQLFELNSHFCIIQSLCQQHWKKADFKLAEPAVNHNSSTLLHKSVDHALNSFGRDILTKREQEVAVLIAQGFDSKEIALKFTISEGTVKNHRKRIYQQLNVASLSEFFQLFYNHLITQSK